jgi:hypothetical protein
MPEWGGGYNDAELLYLFDYDYNDGSRTLEMSAVNSYWQVGTQVLSYEWTVTDNDYSEDYSFTSVTYGEESQIVLPRQFIRDPPFEDYPAYQTFFVILTMTVLDSDNQTPTGGVGSYEVYDSVLIRFKIPVPTARFIVNPQRAGQEDQYFSTPSGITHLDGRGSSTQPISTYPDGKYPEGLYIIGDPGFIPLGPNRTFYGDYGYKWEIAFYRGAQFNYDSKIFEIFNDQITYFSLKDLYPNYRDEIEYYYYDNTYYYTALVRLTVTDYWGKSDSSDVEYINILETGGGWNLGSIPG